MFLSRSVLACSEAPPGFLCGQSASSSLIDGESFNVYTDEFKADEAAEPARSGH
jgi:hypothetical protein